MQREFPLGTIQSWSGSIASIPRTWRLCDGTLNTPNLRNKFIVGSGDTYAVDAVGGSVNHAHPFTGDGHQHTIPVDTDIRAAANFHNTLAISPTAGNTNLANGLAPYYALCYIMYRGRIR